MQLFENYAIFICWTRCWHDIDHMMICTVHFVLFYMLIYLFCIVPIVSEINGYNIIRTIFLLYLKSVEAGKTRAKNFSRKDQDAIITY